MLWLKGRLSDRDLLLGSALVPEVVFIANLPERRAYRALCEALRYWRSKGCVAVICRTGTATVASHLLKLGAVTGQAENTTPPKTRYLVPPAGFARWAAKIEKSTL